jgi:hypothetical protein
MAAFTAWMDRRHWIALNCVNDPRPVRLDESSAAYVRLDESSAGQTVQQYINYRSFEIQRWL